MPGSADAVFQEVLEIQIDASSFVDGLAQLESAYDDFVERVNTKGYGAGNVINVASFAELQGQLSGLEGALTDFTAATTASFDSLDGKLNQVAADAAKAGQAVASAQAAAAQSGGAAAAGGSGAGGLNSLVPVVNSLNAGNTGILSMLASTGRFLVLWRAVGVVIDGVMKVLTSPAEFLKSGFEYLEKLQDSAAELQGILASNVEYSKNLGDNFVLAGQSAEQVIKKLQDLAIATGLPLESLQRTFESVIQSGALHYVSTMGQAVTLAQDFSVLMKAAGSGMEGQRRILQEIPQLLEGTVSASSRILEVLGISRDRWAEIRAEAQQHGNLVQLLAPYMSNYLAVVGDANERQTALTQSVTLLSERIAGAIAVPLWQAWIKLLQDAKGYLETHADLIEKVGSSAVNLVSQFVQLVAKIGEAVTGYTSLDQLADAFLTKTEEVVGNMLVLVKQINAAVDAVEKAEKEHDRNPTDADKFIDSVTKSFSGQPDQKEALDYAQKNIGPVGTMEDALDAVINKARDAASLIAALKTDTLNAGHEVDLDTQVAAKKPLGDLDPTNKKANDAFKILQNQYRDELAETKDAFQNAEKDIKSAQDEGTISAKTAAQQRVAAIAEELASIRQLVNEYTALAQKSGADPKGVKEFTDTLAKVGQVATGDASAGITSANAVSAKADEETTQKHLEALRTMEVQHAQVMLALYKQEAAEGLHSKVEVFDQEIATKRQ